MIPHGGIMLVEQRVDVCTTPYGVKGMIPKGSYLFYQLMIPKGSDDLIPFLPTDDPEWIR
jgi:hypothetical protein